MSLDLFTPQIWFRSFSFDFTMSALFWDGNASDDLTGVDNKYTGYENTSDNVLWILFNSLDEIAVAVKKRGFDRWVDFQDHDVEIIG